MSLTKQQLIAEREMYRAGLGTLRKQQADLTHTVAAQLGVIDFLDRKIDELEREEKAATAPAPHPRSDAAEPE